MALGRSGDAVRSGSSRQHSEGSRVLTILFEGVTKNQGDSIASPRFSRKDNLMDADDRIKSAIEEHWSASESGDTETEHAIYADDAILDYPQSGERYRGRAAIAAQRGGHPANRHFTVHRIVGSQDLWVSECTITYDGVPTYSVSIMEFSGGHAVHETQYFADPFGAPAWRAALAEPMPGRSIAGA
jgi:hypothetical protein